MSSAILRFALGRAARGVASDLPACSTWSLALPRLDGAALTSDVVTPHSCVQITRTHSSASHALRTLTQRCACSACSAAQPSSWMMNRSYASGGNASEQPKPAGSQGVAEPNDASEAQKPPQEDAGSGSDADSVEVDAERLAADLQKTTDELQAQTQQVRVLACASGCTASAVPCSAQVNR